MTRSVSTRTYVAFGWMMLVGLAGVLFVVGETLDDPGGWAAVALVGSWLVPLVVLAWLAVNRPEAARPVFFAGTVLVGGFSVLDSALGIVPRDARGPFGGIAVFALAVALSFFGLQHARLTGLLLLALGAAQLVATMFDEPARGGLGLHLGGSSGVVVVPVLVGAALFLIAGHGKDGAVRKVHTPRHLTGT